MSTMTFADLAAFAIDTRSLPPMEQGTTHRNGKRGDVKRSNAAKQETRTRKQVRALKMIGA